MNYVPQNDNAAPDIDETDVRFAVNFAATRAAHLMVLGSAFAAFVQLLVNIVCNFFVAPTPLLEHVPGVALFGFVASMFVAAFRVCGDHAAALERGDAWAAQEEKKLGLSGAIALIFVVAAVVARHY